MSRYTPQKLIKINKKLWYSPDEGCFRKNVEEGFIGLVAGTIREDTEGERFREISGVEVARLVWKQETGELPPRVYHKNLNRLDCRIENLTTEIRDLGIDPGGELIYMAQRFM